MTPSSTTVVENISTYEHTMSREKFVLVNKQQQTTCEEFLTIDDTTKEPTKPASKTQSAIDNNEAAALNISSPTSHSKQLELELAYSIIEQYKIKCQEIEKERDALMEANQQWEKYYKNSRHCKSPKKCRQISSEVEILKQQLDIYKDDFAMERRDRVRAVMELKKLRIENERLKNGCH